MKIRALATLILCGALAFTVQASPILYSQIGDTQSGRQTNASSQTPTSSQENVSSNLIVESLDRPEFVRLADGRLIPYGPGVICSDECVEGAAFSPSGFPRKWLIALPIAGAAIVGVILATDSPRTPRTAVDGVSQPPTTNPTPNPSPTPNPVCTGGNCNDQPEPVPEPGTIALMGAGLAVLSQRRIRELIKRKQK